MPEVSHSELLGGMKTLDDLYAVGRVGIYGYTGTGKSNHAKYVYHGTSLHALCINPTAKTLGGHRFEDAAKWRGLLAKGVPRCELAVGEFSTPAEINEKLEVIKRAIVEIGTGLQPDMARDAPAWLLIVAEEVHKYCPQPSTAANFMRWVLAEGRKYGVRCILSSQKPQKVDKECLDQADYTVMYQLQNVGPARLRYLADYAIPYDEFSHVFKEPYHHVLIRNGAWLHCKPVPNMDGVR